MTIMYCTECDGQISASAVTCPHCGYPLKNGTVKIEAKIIKEKGKWATGRLVIGILSIVFFFLIGFQSCAAGLGNALSQNGEISGSFGVLTALLMMAAGIVGLATRNSAAKGGPIVTCGLLWLCFFLSRMGAGSYSDLKIWGVIAFAFGCVYLFAAMKQKKGMIISAGIAVAYFILGMI